MNADSRFPIVDFTNPSPAVISAIEEMQQLVRTHSPKMKVDSDNYARTFVSMTPRDIFLKIGSNPLFTALGFGFAANQMTMHLDLPPGEVSERARVLLRTIFVLIDR